MSKILKEVNDYYTKKVIKHGATPQGVDWNGKESQFLRFSILSRLFENSNKKFSLLDFGCGFGSLIEYLDQTDISCKYYGYDISPKMIETAANLYSNRKDTQFSSSFNSQIFDFTLASGIFNVKGENFSNDEWLSYILETLNQISSNSKLGFSFNCLTKYSDHEFMKDYLYYADPLMLFDYCKTRFGKNVALLHDYNLYEFTIIVRKDG